MESFTDLLTDAFSETSAPSFPEEDLDFENLNFDEKCGDDEAESVSTETDGALLQEASVETAALCGEDEKDALCLSGNVCKSLTEEQSDEEDFVGAAVSLVSMSEAPEEDYTSSNGDSEEGDSEEEDSEEEDSASEDDEEEDGEKPGDLLMSLGCTGEVYITEKEDRIFAEGQPLALQGAGDPQVSNKEQGEAGKDEDVSYFEGVPEKGREVMIQGAACEEDGQEGCGEKQEFSSDLETEDMKIRQEENVLTQRVEQEVKHPYGPDPVMASLEFPSISLQNLQDLIAEVDGEECVEKMKEFSGEEHQEAGESFADYPSDYSSCEYVEDGGRSPEREAKADASIGTSVCGSEVQHKVCLDVDAIESPDDNDDVYLLSTDSETNANELTRQTVAGSDKDEWKTAAFEFTRSYRDEMGESDSYSSSDDDFKMRRSSEEFFENKVQQGPRHKYPLEDSQFHRGGGSFPHSLDDDLMTNNRVNPTYFVSWDFDVLKAGTPQSECVLTTQDADKTQTPASGVSPSEHVNSYSVVMSADTKTTRPSYQGSLDDSFFFNTEKETSWVTEVGQKGNNEFEEERNWEQEQKRIKAFFEYYDDSDEEDGREGRQIKVQFSADPLSQVIHYESDSDADSVSSSTDREEDPSSADASDELAEPRDSQQMNPECNPADAQVQDNLSHHSNTQIRARRHRCLSMLKWMLKMVLVVVIGLAVYWLFTDQADWLGQVFFF